VDLEATELETLRQVFLDDADRCLAVLDESLVALERHPTDSEMLGTVFRAAHTIKGNASMVGLDAIEQLAHAIEEVLGKLRDGTGTPTEDVVTLLLAGVDGVREMVGAVARGAAPELAPYETLRSALEAWRPTAEPSVPEASGGSPSDAPARRRTVRVDIAKLDKLLEAVGELVIARQMFAERLAARDGSSMAALRDSFDDTQSLMQELRDAVTEMRLVPLGPTFRRLARPVRDMASAAGKDVHLIVQGEAVEVDTAIVDQLNDPLTHLLRNAVDHGLEPADAREAAGKPRSGTVTLGAHRAGGTVVVEVSDDGAGLDRSKLVARARDQGIVDTEELSDEALWELIFEPGFSTADAVTELSGRGVGMDAVRRTVEGLRGSVTVRSHEGVGTTIALHVPLTLTMIGGLAVRVAGDTYIVPFENVVECVDAPSRVALAPSGVIRFRDATLAYTGLRGIFAPDSAPPTDRQSLVVVRHGDLIAGLVVDALIGETEAMVRPLSDRLAGLRRIGGSAVLGDGRIALILDVPSILRTLTQENGASK
jgi:two-component system chemotaxis sensor kinase CheA